MDAKGIIWLSKKCTVVLREASERPRSIWVQDKYIRPMRGQQDDRQKIANSMLARGRLQDFKRRRKQGEKMIQWQDS